MPKIIGGSLGAHREEMRKRIFAAFDDLLASHGYADLTLAEIAAAAGLGRTAMYNYHPDKESLLLAFTDHETEIYLADLGSRLADVTNPIEQLMVYIRAEMEKLAGQHVSPSSLTGLLSDVGRNRMREHVMPLWQVLLEILNSAVEEDYLPDGNTMTKLHLVSASTSGRWSKDLAGEQLDEAIREVTAFVLRGLGVQLDLSGSPLRLSR
ncbi:MAG: TetR/AcrR family transcriptional regulator [Nocardioides sp.]|nr:TetR/AcrR family transcriptional regulator [Nocardioides sp.]